MIDEQTEEQASAFVLGILPPAESAAFERSLADHEELGRLVASLNNATLALAESAPKVVPPAELRRALLRDLEASAGAQTKAVPMQSQENQASVGVAQSPAHVEVEEAAVASAANPFIFVGRDDGRWQTLPIPGVRVKDLSVDVRRGTSVKLYELAPGARFPQHHHSGPEECYVLSGDFHVEGRVLQGGDFHHAESGSDHGESFTEKGCTLLVMVSTDDYK